MNNNKHQLRGGISVPIIATIIIIAIAGAYFYVDKKADTQAQQVMMQLAQEAKSQGIDISYSSVDASPLMQNVTVNDFNLTGLEKEPDISLASIVITGFNWQSLTSETPQLPLEMNIKLGKGILHLKPSMVKGDANLQALVDTFGEKIGFSSALAYKLNVETGIFDLSFTQAISNIAYFNSYFSFGNAAWLADLQMEDQDTSKIIETTLNRVEVIFKNKGIIEKLRTVAIKKTGKTSAQLTHEAVVNMKNIRVTAEKSWGPLFLPLIDELIIFAQNPQQLHLSIHPEQPLKSDVLMLALMSGDIGWLELIKKTRLRVKAN